MTTVEAGTPRWDFFLAHARADTKAAERLFDLLVGNSRPFLDSRRLDYGDDWDQELPVAQQHSRITVVLVSSHTDQAFYLRDEIQAAIDLARADPTGHRVVPVYLHPDVKPPYGLGVKHSMYVTAESPLKTIAGRLLKLLATHYPSESDKPPPRFDYTTLQFVGVLTGADDEELYSVAFSAAGTIAAGSNKKILLWDRDRPTEPRVFEHDSYVYSVAFSLDGHWLASGGQDGTVRVYSVSDGALRWAPSKHDDAVYSVAFSGDGSRLASGGYDHLVKLWDARTGRPMPELRLQGKVTSVAFSPKDQNLLAIGDLMDTVTLWDGRVFRRLKGHTSSVETVAFSPDGRLVASAGLDKMVRCWDVARRMKKWIGVGHEYLVRSVCFTPDGQTVASASWDKTVRLWDAETGDAKATIPWAELKQDRRWHTDWIWSIAFSQNGMLVATGGSDGQIILLRVAEPE